MNKQYVSSGTDWETLIENFSKDRNQTRSTTPVDHRHLKFKEQKPKIIASSLKKTSSTYKFLLKISRFQGFMKVMAIFYHTHQKITESTFSFLSFYQHTKINLFHHSIFVRRSILGVLRLDTLVFDNVHPKMF